MGKCCIYAHENGCSTYLLFIIEVGICNSITVLEFLRMRLNHIPTELTLLLKTKEIHMEELNAMNIKARNVCLLKASPISNL